MKVNSQIRRESWKRLFSVWFWRLVLGSAVIGLATNLPVYFLREYHESREIVSVTDFLRQRLEALSQGMDWSLPTPEAVRQMYLAGSLEVLAMIVFGAIAALGMVSLSLSACRNRQPGWFQSGFKGFLRPLSVAWLLLVQNVLISLGFCLFIIPGVILIYRYRQAWYLKSENPDWGAFRCLRASARMMKGRKAQAFFLDASCFCWLVLPCALMVAGIVLCLHGDYAHDALKGLIGSLILLFAYAVAFLVGLWMLICRGTFYLAVKAEQSAEEGDDFPETISKIQALMREASLFEEDLEEQFILGSGPGGQKTNKTSCVVRLSHGPSALCVRCGETRSRETNRWLARRLLAERILEAEHKRKSAATAAREKVRRQKRRRSRRQKAKILADKRAHGEIKALRRRVDES